MSTLVIVTGGQRDRLDRFDRRDDVDATPRLSRSALATCQIDLHGDPLPLVGAGVGRDRRPLVLVLEPARTQLEIAFSSVARSIPYDHGLCLQRHDDVRVLYEVDVPRRR